MPKEKPSRSRLDQYDFTSDDYIYSRAKYLGPAIGEFLIAFSQLEHALNIGLVNLISDRSHHQGYLFIRKMNVFTKIEVFGDSLKPFINWKSPSGKILLKKELDKLIEDLKSLNRIRNDIAHANWETLQVGYKVRIKIYVSQEDGTIEFEEKTLPVPFIKKNARACERIWDRIEKIFEKLEIAFP